MGSFFGRPTPQAHQAAGNPSRPQSGRHNFLCAHAVKAFQLDPNDSHLIEFCDLFSADERPATKAEVDFCLWKRKFQDRCHDPPELFGCTVADRHLCVARFCAFLPSSSALEGLQDPRCE